MTALAAAALLLVLLLVLLGGGVWIAIALAAVAWAGLAFFTSTPPDVSLFQSFWGSSRSEERRVGKECRSRWSPYH